MNYLLMIVIFLFVGNYANAEIILYGEAKYDVKSAQDEVVNSVQFNVNPQQFFPYILDNNYDENRKAILNGQLRLKDRQLATFSNGSYGVTYNSDLYHAYYYSTQGILEFIDVKTGIEYPYKSYQYNIYGELNNMGLRVSKNETYIFSPNQNLIAHWIDGNAYNEKGEIILKRQYYE